MSWLPCRRYITAIRQRFFHSGKDESLAAMEAHLAALQLNEADISGAIQWARAQIDGQANVTIDRGETLSRIRPDGLEIQAWYRIPHEALAALRSPDPATAEVVINMSPVTRAIFALHVHYGMSIEEMAHNFRIRPWTLRRHLRRAIRLLARNTVQRVNAKHSV